ncbi:PilZ domain-containing protein [Thioalkalivibrio sp. ALgr3]|uniref:PilZ domain-containing protein n=1 Tax=Thioalkalivibrio sp. ALgr3 TaxID=1239292 RepID=UPI000378E0B7|nr:PilZ domain-containing protein [Thioalkalivibrio sp. ALgr3]
MFGEEDRRRDRRIPVGVTGEVYWTGSGQTTRVEIHDLAAGGCALMTGFEVDAGVGVMVTVPSPDPRIENLQRRGRVLRCDSADPDREGRRRWRLAVAFEEEPTGDATP